MIVDCFTFYNELDILKKRLTYLSPVVDKFVLVESTVTHKGEDKILYYDRYKNLFDEWNHKIIHVIVDHNPPAFNPWTRENFQRNSIMRGLNNFKDDDYVMISDVDEIPNRNFINLPQGVDAKVFHMIAFEYSFKYIQDHEPWFGTVLTKRKVLDTFKPQDLRNMRFKLLKHANCGWHLSSFGDEEFVKNKLANYAHCYDEGIKNINVGELLNNGYFHSNEKRKLIETNDDFLSNIPKEITSENDTCTTFKTVKFGFIYGNHYLMNDLGFTNDNESNLITVSNLLETHVFWDKIISKFPNKTIQLFTMFETSDVHPDIIEKMKLFDKVIVPFDFQMNILKKHGVNCTCLNWYTSNIIRDFPRIEKKRNKSDRKVFLYVGNEYCKIRKNLNKMIDVFGKVLEGTAHLLIVKVISNENLPKHANITYINEKLEKNEIIKLYNSCDYVVSFSRGEGVGLSLLEAEYFKKTLIAPKCGVLKHRKIDNWIELPTKEVPIDLNKVFHGCWDEVDEDKALEIIKNIVHQV